MLEFNGQRPDLITGGYLLGNGHRLYSPAIMRFCSADALSPFGKGGLNAYSYCIGDPVNASDPTGRWPNFSKTFSGGTGVSAALKENALPKDWLKKYLKPLTKPTGRKKTLSVYKFYDDQVEFEWIQFEGTGTKVHARSLGRIEYSRMRGNYYIQDNVYIPRLSPDLDASFANKGFKIGALAYSPYLDARSDTLSTGQRQQSNNSTRVENNYTKDPVESVIRVRQQ